MSIKQISQQSNVSYAASQTRSQKIIEIKKNDPRHSDNQDRSASQLIAMEMVEFTSQATSASHEAGESSPQETYQRPLPPDLLRNKILLEKIFDVEIHEAPEELKQAIADLDVSSQAATDTTRLSDIPVTSAQITATPSFDEDSELLIMDTHTHSQDLNFTSSGVYSINDKTYHSQFSLSLSEKRSSMTEVRQAVNLRDPLVVQFGPQALGQLNGQRSDIDINSDGVVDSLPMFDGDVGYLVHDKNNNNHADNGSELFGPQSGNGFNDLSALDSNKNGFIDPEDKEYSALKIWQIDSNGSESWRSLADTDIHAISLNSTATPFNFYDDEQKLQAKLTRSSVALTEQGKAYGVHQIDVKI